MPHLALEVKGAEYLETHSEEPVAVEDGTERAAHGVRTTLLGTPDSEGVRQTSQTTAGARQEASRNNEIFQAEPKAIAEEQVKSFVEKHSGRYSKAVASLLEDEEKRLAFYDFAAAHFRQ